MDYTITDMLIELQGIWYNEDAGLELTIKGEDVSYNWGTKYTTEKFTINEVPELNAF